MNEPLKITRSEYGRVRTAWVTGEINQPKFMKMFQPLGESDRPFPYHDVSPFEFLRKHIERQTQIAASQRDFDSERERLRKIFDDGAKDGGVMIMDDAAEVVRVEPGP